MNFPSPLIKGTLLKHYRRTLVDVRLNDGHVVTAHAFFAGPLNSYNTPGSTVLLSDSGDRSRKNQLTWELVEVGRILVGVNPKIGKHALLEAITLDQIDSLRGYRLDDGIVGGVEPSGEILLHSMKDNCLLSYQAVIGVVDGVATVAMDPDSVVRKHLARMMDFARRGHRAIAFYHVLRSDCTAIQSSATKGDGAGTLFREAKDAGVEHLAYRAGITPDGVEVGIPLPWVGG